MSDRQYYQVHYQEYFQKTANLDSAFLNPLLKHLYPGCRVLDVGCGAGRDLLYLKKMGFVPTGFERSAGLAELARSHSGCPVIEGDFNTYNFGALAADAIVMSGSLVHTHPSGLVKTLSNILNAFAADRRLPQIAYLSLKEGCGSRIDPDGRRFYYWNEGTLCQTLKTIGLVCLEMKRSASADGKGKTWLGFITQFICDSSPQFRRNKGCGNLFPGTACETLPPEKPDP